MTHEADHPMPAIIMHYVHLTCMVVLGISGLYIHSPFAPNLMGTMRVAHFIAMYIVLINLVVRIYWSIFGSARDIRRYLPEKENKGKIIPIVMYYLFLKKKHPVTAKYNPLQKMTYVSWIVLLIVQGLTGFALYWPTVGFLSSLNTMVGGLLMMRMIHFLISWLFVLTVAIHVYLSLAEDVHQFLIMFFNAKEKEAA